MTTRSARILLVEDDYDIRESMKEVLEDEGYIVDAAVDGLDALAQLRAAEQLPQLILLDLMMPRMNGLELHRELAKVPAWAAIPVVVLSADADVRNKARALMAQAFLQKPIQLSALFETVAHALRCAV